MEDNGAVTLYNGSAITTDAKKNPYSIKVGLAQMLRGGAILEVVDSRQAKIAEEAGASCVMVSEPTVPGCGISRMPDPSLVKEIKRSVSVPVLARVRVGHFVEAQILEAIDVDYIDESEFLAPADEDHFVNKHNFGVPFVCGCRGLGEALRRVREGAAMIRAQGDLASGNIAQTVKSVRSVMGDIRILNNMDEDEVFAFSKKIAAPYDLVAQTKQMGRLPVVLFAGGGIVTPADAALMMQLGCDGVFVGNEVFDGCDDPYKRVRGIIQAVRHYNDPHVLVESSSSGLEDVMTQLNLGEARIEQ
ncbi:Pyridoxal 5'-phosphate synthase-like subunit PDX1.2 [Linum perenne]